MADTEIKPSSAAEIIKDFQGDTKVVKAGEHFYRIKKINLLEIGFSKIAGLPSFSEKETTEKDIASEMSSYLKDPRNKIEIMNEALLRFVLEPQIVDGPSNADKNQVSLASIPELEKLELAGAVLSYSGYSGEKAQFFREAAGAIGTGPGPDSPAVRDPAEPVAAIAG